MRTNGNSTLGGGSVGSDAACKETTTWLVKLKSKNGHVNSLVGGSTDVTPDGQQSPTTDDSTSSLASDGPSRPPGGGSNGLHTLRVSQEEVQRFIKREASCQAGAAATNTGSEKVVTAAVDVHRFKREYLCPVCLRLFGNQPALTVHRREQHQDHEDLACVLCDGVQFATKSMLLQHNATNHCMDVSRTPKVRGRRDF